MRQRLRRMSQELSIEWGFHAPCSDISLFSYHPAIADAISKVMHNIVDFCKDLSAGKSTVVLHTGASHTFKRARESMDAFSTQHKDLLRETLLRQLSDIIDVAVPDVSVCIENHEWNEVTRDVIRELIPEGLRLCMDVPKLYDPSMASKGEDMALFEKNADAIEVVHIHDWDPALGSHQVIGEGKLDFSVPLRFLAGLGKPPLYVFEVRPRELAQLSLNNLRMVIQNLK
jgi:sugar phosphate isomerase/epimerase